MNSQTRLGRGSWGIAFAAQASEDDSGRSNHTAELIIKLNGPIPEPDLGIVGDLICQVFEAKT